MKTTMITLITILHVILRVVPIRNDDDDDVNVRFVLYSELFNSITLTLFLHLTYVSNTMGDVCDGKNQTNNNHSTYSKRRMMLVKIKIKTLMTIYKVTNSETPVSSFLQRQ